ncbi:MAG: histidine phosphotransferase family protein [Gemmobacter sp.]
MHDMPYRPDPATSTQAPDLAALIGSRICHDLISPIGAIGNGVELLMMEGATKSPEIALISESVAHANARIRFFRVAFGAASPGQRIGRPEVMSILADTTRGGRLSIDWQGPQDLARTEVKAVFLALMACETAMAYGGRITVMQEAGPDDANWTVIGQAARLRLDPALWAGLAGAATLPTTASLVHFALLSGTVGALGRRLAVETGDTDLRLSF